jgi:hypothetical protein
MQSKARTVADYLAALPDDRRAALSAVREVILANLDPEYEERMQYGMIGYCVPHRVYPAGYHVDPAQPLPFAGLASQKAHMSIYLMGCYVDGEDSDEVRRFRAAWEATGRKLDMGKSCVRFKRIEQVALDVLGEAIRAMPARRFVARYEATLAARPARKPAAAGGAGSRARTRQGGPAPATKPAPPRRSAKGSGRAGAASAGKGSSREGSSREGSSGKGSPIKGSPGKQTAKAGVGAGRTRRARAVAKAPANAGKIQGKSSRKKTRR